MPASSRPYSSTGYAVQLVAFSTLLFQLPPARLYIWYAFMRSWYAWGEKNVRLASLNLTGKVLIDSAAALVGSVFRSCSASRLYQLPSIAQPWLRISSASAESSPVRSSGALALRVDSARLSAAMRSRISCAIFTLPRCRPPLYP